MTASCEQSIVASKYSMGKHYITLVGCCATCSEGDHCKVLVSLKKDKKYGYQYEIKKQLFFYS